MTLRTQLITAFFILALIPLTGLALYSYISSMRSIRLAEENVARQRTEEMGAEIDDVYDELRTRMNLVGPEMFYRLLDADAQAESSTVSDLYKQLYAGFGELSTLVRSLDFKPPSDLEASKGSELDAQMNEIDVENMAEIDSFTISLPQFPYWNQPQSDLLNEINIGIIIDKGRDGRVVKIAPEIPPLENLKLNADLAEQVGKKFVTGYIKEFIPSAHKLFYDSEKTLEYLKELKTLTRDTEEKLDPSHALPVHRPDSRFEIFGTDTTDEQIRMPLTMIGDAKGRFDSNISAQIEVRDLLRRILPLTSPDTGEVPFALSPDGRLYTTNQERFDLLDGLGLQPGTYSTLKSSDDQWVVVARKDTVSDITLGIARPIGDSLRHLRTTMLRNLGMGIALICFALVGILRISSHMTAKLSVLASGAKRLAEGDLDTRVPVTSKDEFGDLARVFNQMAGDLQAQRRKAIEKERLEKELELCRQIQREMLPKGPLRLPFAEIHGHSIPAYEVGGDFFNFFALNAHQVAILVGDVSGKGFPAALLMANIQATLKARLIADHDLADLAENLDREIHGSTPKGTFLTLFIGVLDESTGTLRWMSAGHNPQYLIRQNGELESMGSTGRPLGLLPGAAFAEGSLSVEQGDTLFLYTDGLVESPNEAGDEFGNDRLAQILTECSDREPPALISCVERELLNHRGSTPAHDDTTMVMMQISSISETIPV